MRRLQRWKKRVLKKELLLPRELGVFALRGFVARFGVC